MKAIKTIGNGKAALQSDLPIPTLQPDFVLVRTKAVALNPTDWKHMDWVSTPSTLGCDFAGIIEEVGPEVKRPWKKGDRVFGFAHGGNIWHPETGAFSEVVTARGDILMKIPEGVTFEEAATLPVGVMTNVMGLYQHMGLPPPSQTEEKAKGDGEGKKQILIYGGSTATGMLAIQFAKLSGFEVITTCSPRNFSLVKSLGADHVFDYASPTVGADINALTKDTLLYAFDTISEGDSPAISTRALASKPINGQKPNYGAILIVPKEKLGRPAEEVNHIFSLIYTIAGKRFVYITTEFEERPEDTKFFVDFVPILEKLVGEGKVKPHRFEVRGGWEDILDGLQEMREGKVSGLKLVYRVGEA